MFFSHYFSFCWLSILSSLLVLHWILLIFFFLGCIFYFFVCFIVFYWHQTFKILPCWVLAIFFFIPINFPSWGNMANLFWILWFFHSFKIYYYYCWKLRNILCKEVILDQPYLSFRGHLTVSGEFLIGKTRGKVVSISNG